MDDLEGVAACRSGWISKEAWVHAKSEGSAKGGSVAEVDIDARGRRSVVRTDGNEGEGVWIG